MELAADLVNPLLGLCMVLGACWCRRVGKLDRPWRYAIRSATGVGLVYACTRVLR